MKDHANVAVRAGLAVLFVAAGSAKLAGTDMMVHEFEVIGIGQWLRVPFGLLEITGGLCLLASRLAVLGAALVAALAVGAHGATLGHVASLAMKSSGMDHPQPAVLRLHDANARLDAPARRNFAMPV